MHIGQIQLNRAHYTYDVMIGGHFIIDFDDEQRARDYLEKALNARNNPGPGSKIRLSQREIDGIQRSLSNGFPISEVIEVRFPGLQGKQWHMPNAGIIMVMGIS